LEYFKQALDDPDPFNILLLDYIMPKMDGIEIVEKTIALLNDTPKAKIFLLSSSNIKGNRREMNKIGVDRVLSKPLTAEDLKRVLLQEIEGRNISIPEDPSLPDIDLVETVSRKKLTILLAEDNPINRKLVERFLKKKNWKVIHAKNGEEAVQLYRENSPDLILMDIQMPEVDGYEASVRIREIETQDGSNRKHTPIIALTAHAISTYREKSFSMGMDDY
ncbi:MAG: response regulator, partial [bacterium]|nr:response regulator [bacterium]